MTHTKQFEKYLESGIIAGPVSEEQIKEAERTLAVRFPPSYRAFLAKYGAALVDAIDIPGIYVVGDSKDGPPLWLDVVLTTKQTRRALKDRLPLDYVWISHDGCDHAFYLATSQFTDNGECPVVVLGPRADNVAIADNFVDFFIQRVENRLSY
jgi:hypothetical protein